MDILIRLIDLIIRFKDVFSPLGRFFTLGTAFAIEAMRSAIEKL